LAINIEGKIGQLTVIRTSSFINQIRAPGGHIQLTNMIDTQQQYIKLNIHGEESIIVVQAHSDRKRDTPVYAHKRTHTYSHIYNDEKLWVQDISSIVPFRS
jgi:hypothetical protein